MSRGEVVKSGYLTKSPPEGRLGQWQRRWFVFADSHRAYPLAPRYVRMEYYQSAEDAEMCRNPKGIIDLKTCSKVTNRENMRGFKHVFDVCTSDRNYHLVAESDVDKRTWIETINTTLFTASSSSPVPPPDTQQQQQRNRPVGFSQSSSSVNGATSSQDKERRINSPAEPPVSRQSSRPLPPVPGNTAANRPLPPTPTDHAARTPSQNVSIQNSRPPPPPPPTHYKRLSGSEGVSIKHQLVRQVKSTNTLTEGPNRYQLSVAPDYQNLDDGSANQQSMCNRYQLSVAPDYQNLDDGSANQQSQPSPAVDPRDYVNLDEDYDDTVTESCVYEDYVSRPAGGTAPLAPISGGHEYVNVESSAPETDPENYSVLEAGPNEQSGDYSVLEAVHPQSAEGGEEYSRLELTGHLDLGPPKIPPKKPPPYGASRKDVDYENLGHVAHPGTGEYSSLHY